MQALSKVFKIIITVSTHPPAPVSEGPLAEAPAAVSSPLSSFSLSALFSPWNSEQL